MTGPLSRVTLAGPRRRVDLVLPSDEPIGVLLPEILDITGHAPGPVPAAHQLSLLDGRVLDAATSLRGADVPDGAVLRVHPRVEAPPAPVVLDLTDEVADDLHRRPGRWDGSARRWTATAVLVLAAAAAALLAPGRTGATAVGLLGGALMVCGVLLAAGGIRPAGVASQLAGAGACAVAVAGWTPDPGGRAVLWLLVVVLGGATLGASTGHGRAAVLGAGAALVQLTGWLWLLAADVPLPGTAAVLGVLAVVGIGLLPRAALVTSGLTRLDDRLGDGHPVPRVAAAAAIDAAHRGLAPAVVATAVSGGVAGAVLGASGSPFATALAGALAVVLLLRLRAHPLTVEVVALVAAALAAVGGVVGEGPVWGAVVATGAVAVMAMVVLTYRPAAHVLARGRRLADRVEAVAVVALVPLAVGVFGVYTRLLGAF